MLAQVKRVEGLPKGQWLCQRVGQGTANDWETDETFESEL